MDRPMKIEPGTMLHTNERMDLFNEPPVNGMMLGNSFQIDAGYPIVILTTTRYETDATRPTNWLCLVLGNGRMGWAWSMYIRIVAE